MKILIKECKNHGYPGIACYSSIYGAVLPVVFRSDDLSGGRADNKFPYDMPFYAELIESWGTSLPREDWSKLDEKRKELEEAYTRIIAADPVLADAKITNYQEFSKTRETFLIRIL